MARFPRSLVSTYQFTCSLLPHRHYLRYQAPAGEPFPSRRNKYGRSRLSSKKARKEYAVMYPGYCFRPVHNKVKSKKNGRGALRSSRTATARGQEVWRTRCCHPQARSEDCPHTLFIPTNVHRHHQYLSPIRIVIPSHCLLCRSCKWAHALAHQPATSRSARMLMGQRRPSSVQPIPSRPWGAISSIMFPQHEMSPLPDVDNTLFDPAFLDAGFSMPAPEADSPFVSRCSFSLHPIPYSIHHFRTSTSYAQSHPTPSRPTSAWPRWTSPPRISPSTPQRPATPPPCPTTLRQASTWTWASPAATLQPVDPTAIPDFPEFADLAELSQSQPSSAYSGSPAHSDVSLPLAASQPQSFHDHTGLSFEAWQEGATQMHGAPTPASVSDMATQVGIGLDGLFDSAFGVEASNGGLALGFDYVPL